MPPTFAQERANDVWGLILVLIRRKVRVHRRPVRRVTLFETASLDRSVSLRKRGRGALLMRPAASPPTVGSQTGTDA